MAVVNLGGTPLLEPQYLSFLVSYLRLTGWRLRESSNWYEFSGGADIEGAPLLLVLPRDANSPEAPRYIEKALVILGVAMKESPIIAAQRVQYYHSDVVLVRNLETGFYSSITLNLADRQITELKQLVGYAARSEKEPRPFFHTPSSTVQRVAKQFRFGHTVRQSFGLTLEAPIIGEMELYVSERSADQPPLLQDLSDYIEQQDIAVPPLERRIVERIIRGLRIAGRAVQESSIRPLIEDYGTGLNGNMCRALDRLGDENRQIEYRVLWSPKVPVSADLLETSPILANETMYTLLREASAEMKVLQPQWERIRGIVTHVGSHAAPLGEGDTGRQVIIRWIRDDKERTANVIAPLNKEQYLLAHKAHLEWATIEVTGVIERSGATYRLLDATDLRILNPLTHS